MNFKELQAMQAKLDEAILKEKAPMTADERFNKTLVALSVEIAEVANTVEHFKFWKDNKGKVDSDKFSLITYVNKDDEYYHHERICTQSFEQAHHLTLIEECSDALHFILSLANQLGVELELNFRWYNKGISKEENYLSIQNWVVIGFNEDQRDGILAKSLLVDCLNYFELSGVTEQELEQAYYDKNKVNYERLENGY